MQSAILAKPSKSHDKYCKLVRRAKVKARRTARTSLVNSSVINTVPIVIQSNRQSRPRARPGQQFKKEAFQENTVKLNKKL